MNLSTARSEKRAREVGVRKTLGSDKKQLIFQFFSESIILVAIAFVLSVIAVYLLLPSFNSLVDKHLSLDISQPLFWAAAIALILFTGIVAGSYPALYLSSFNPVKVLKGTFLAGKRSALPRHILVIAQFSISILLISATIIIYQQIQHIKNRDIGYDPDNLIMIPGSDDTQKNYAAIKDELMKTGVISIVNRSFSPITEIWWKAPAPDWDGKPAGAELIVASMATDVDYAKTMGVKIIEGKDFSGVPADSANMVINEAAVKAMQLKNPIGTQFRYGPRKYNVIGVASNIVMESPFKAVDPMLVYFDPNNSNSINVRLKASVKPQEALRSIEAVFKKYNPAFPFDYKFVDEEFGKKFLTENLISRITNIFAGLAIFICCIGLAGLASFTIEKRIREIGIRKVMGATLQQLLLLISKDFLKLVLIAFVIATPLTWWFMNNWLEKYPDRISISIWLFGAVGFLILLLALVVVSLNTMKAAIANPIKSLRTE
jgi:ABC-type antimicrobial peptide transport system permease subunit